jgi:hypothetical protein
MNDEEFLDEVSNNQTIKKESARGFSLFVLYPLNVWS